MSLSITGVPWILDVISFSIGRGEDDQTIENIEIVLDLVNLLSVRYSKFEYISNYVLSSGPPDFHHFCVQEINI